MRPELKTKESGFTLTEVLVALSIMSVMSVFLFSSLSWASRSLKTTTILEEKVDIARIQQRLDHIITQSVQKFELGEDGQRRVTFIGNENEIGFTAPEITDITLPGLYRYHISTESDINGTHLVLNSQLFRAQRGRINVVQPKVETTTLIENISELTFSYYIHDEDTDQNYWADEIQDDTRLPQLVKMDVIFNEGDPRAKSWPYMVMRLNVD